MVGAGCKFIVRCLMLFYRTSFRKLRIHNPSFSARASKGAGQKMAFLSITTSTTSISPPIPSGPKPDPEPQPGSDPDLVPRRGPEPDPDPVPQPMPEPMPI